MNPLKNQVDAIVIGAGHNGLVCAAYLAKAGLDVVVLERSDRIGGACITEELVPRCRFSTFAYGAHGPGARICRDLEVPADAITIAELDPGMFAPYPDGDHVMLWADAEKTAAGLSRFGSRESEGYLAYQRFIDRAIGISQEFFLGPPPTHSELYERYRGTPESAVVESLLTRSHWDVLCEHFDSEKVRCALARADDAGAPTAVGGLLSEAIESASMGAGVENKAGIPHGGMGSITQALAAAAERFGAVIRTGAAVEQVVVQAGRAVAVRLVGGEQIHAQVVASNADPKRTFLKLVSATDLDPGFRRQVERIKIRAGYMKYHAVLNGTPRFTAMPDTLADNPRHLASTRIAPSLAYYQQAWLDAQSGIPARDPVMSLQLPTAYLPDLAPPGKHIFGAWIRYAPTNLSDEQWEQHRPQVLDGIVAIVDRYAPGFADQIEWQRLYTPIDIERVAGMTGGSVRHVDQTLDQLLHRRPLSAWRSPIDGLYLCGSGTHPCGSVTGGPGHNAAAAILKDVRSRRHIK